VRRWRPLARAAKAVGAAGAAAGVGAGAAGWEVASKPSAALSPHPDPHVAGELDSK